MYFHTPLYGPLYSTSISTLLPLCTLSYLTSDLSNGTLYPSVYTFTGSLLIQILLMIFPCSPLRYPLLDIFPLHPYTFRFSATSYLLIHLTPSLHRPLSDAACFA